MPRKLFLLAVALLGFASAFAQADKKGRPPLTIEKVAENLYVIIGNGGNVGLLVTNEGCILIDCKFEEDYDAIMAQVKSVTNQPVKYVFNTHYHSDHSGGNTRFLAVAEVISHKNSRANIEGNKQSNAAPNMKPARITFTDETSVFLGGQEVRARYFGRGHTNGDIVIYFPAQKVLHTGDLIASQTPLIDYPGGGSLLEWAKTVDGAMAAFDFDKVIPGHGAVTDRAGMKTYRDNVEKMRAAITQMIRAGRNKDDVRAYLAKEYPAAYANPGSLNNQWSLPGFMTELK